MKYNIEGRIGRGGFGEVFECSNDDGDRFAIKCPFAKDVDINHIKRFQREIRIQSLLNHENIVPIIEEGINENRYYYVMPLANESLDGYLETNEGNIKLFSQIAEGIKYAHENGVIHRDLNPRNILIFIKPSSNISVKICDFGLAKFSIRDSTTLTESHVTMGTEGYMAPEQIRGARDVDHRADIFSLGKILYYMITREDVRIWDLSKVPSKYYYIINRACYVNKEDRFANVEEMIKVIEHVSSPYRPSKPSEMVQAEIKSIMEENNFNAERTENLAKMIAENIDDKIILEEIFPMLPAPILKSLTENHLLIILPSIKAFDESINVDIGLPFQYCDVVANFYLNLFNLTDSYDIKEIVIKRLPKMGYDHNRFHVGRVVGKIVNGLTDENSILMIRDVLRTDKSMANWYKDYFEDIPNLIREIYDE